MSESVLEFRKASLGYDGKPVLTDVDLAVERGAFLGIFGDNGSGKSTLLRTLLGLLPLLKGELVSRGSALGAPRCGYAPQKERLDPLYPLTAYDVAEMGTWRRLEPFRRDPERRRLVEGCLADCGAADLAGRFYSDLSGGQKQRVLIARALAAGPELLVLDEPLAGIDVATRKALLTLFKDLKKSETLTVLMVSHVLQAERGLFTHLAWVEEGRVEHGPAEAMLAGKLGQVFRGEG